MRLIPANRGHRRSLGHYCPLLYEIFMTTPIITRATISLYFVMGETGGAEFLNAPYHCKVGIADAHRPNMLQQTLKDFIQVNANCKRNFKLHFVFRSDFTGTTTTAECSSPNIQIFQRPRIGKSGSLCADAPPQDRPY